ncbi:MAG TPA: hypothetical protein VFD32_01890 [Dehalococcoidia bacterium]|nr:hypothetical protein [Dehalococcoidia bacterium]
MSAIIRERSQGAVAPPLQIVNPDPRYAPARLIEPAPYGYLHIAARVHPRPLPFWPNGRAKAALLARLKRLARRLQQHDAVREVTVFDALAMPPLGRLPYVREHQRSIHLARFDVAVLIETSSPAAVPDVRQDADYQALLGALRGEAADLHVLAARNAKRIGDVDHRRRDTFLFNHFVADDARVMFALWDYLAGWYTTETGLDNSILLMPLEGERSDFLAVNHASWHQGLLRVMWRQFAKRSFWSFVQPNLAANHVGAMPVLYHRV